MSGLEARYRAALAWYPSTWREQNADVVVGTLMDEADAAGRSRPRASELLSLTLHGLSTRLNLYTAISRATRDGLAALSFGAGFAVMAVMFFGEEWAPLAPTNFVEPGFGPFRSAAVIINLLWGVAFAIAVLGLRRWSRAILVVAVVASVIAIVLINATPFLYGRPPATALVMLGVLAVLAMGGRPSRRWLVWSAIFSAASFVGICVLQYATNSWRFDGWLGNGWLISANGWWGIGLFAVAGALVAIRRASWVAPVTVFATIWTIYSVGANFTHHADYAVVFFALVGLVLALAVLAVASMLLRGFRLQLVRPTRE